MSLWFQAGVDQAGAMDQGPAELTTQQAETMEAVSITDSTQNVADIAALLKKIDYDPYNEDEVNHFVYKVD